MRERRTTRLSGDTPKGIEPGSPDDLKVPPPSPALMEHLWDRFGERPTLGHISPHTDMAYGAIAVMAQQEGVEAVLNYLDELLNGDRK